MKKCLFIVPYFGKLPKTLPMFLKSCRLNPDFNWLIITDDKTKYEYPVNVTPLYMSFNSLHLLFEKRLHMMVNLNNPIKFCDLRPAYGFVFKDLLKSYNFWGECDLDVVYGKLNRFITDDMLNKYDKIFELGHMALYKNNDLNNKLFKKNNWYKEAFCASQLCGFDETYQTNKNINTIFLESGKKVFRKSYALDISTIPTRFNKVNYYPTKRLFLIEKKKPSKYLCVWDNGRLLRYHLNKKGQLEFEEYLYIHYQDRKMTLGNIAGSKIKIIPEYIGKLECNNVTKENFKYIRKFKPNKSTLNHYIHYYITTLKRKFLWIKK